MALETQRGSSLPAGAVALSREEALNHQKKFIRNWPSEMDVLFLKYGSHMSAAMTIVSSSIILKHFKQFFKLPFSPYLSFAYVASGVVPCLFSFVFTQKYITDNVLLMKMDCPICDELKFAAGQLYVSVLYPTVFGYFSYGSRAFLENTYYFPNIKAHPREFWQETFRIFKKSIKVFQFVTLFQSAWILFLPYMQNRQLFKVRNKVREDTENENLIEIEDIENEF